MGLEKQKNEAAVSARSKWVWAVDGCGRWGRGPSGDEELNVRESKLARQAVGCRFRWQ